jgi:hypothetical protein
MALASFTLRKTTIGNGSLVRSTGDDSALRADGLVVAELVAAGENEFLANVISEGTIRLEWGLSSPLVNESTIAIGEVGPVQLVIVSSARGEPVTINDGTVVTRVVFDTPYTFFDHVPLVKQGRWVYYSLFVKYSANSLSGIDSWYERLASLYIQIPIQYNSTGNLWKRIPQYYREIDYRQEPLSSGYSPLYTFIDLIGDEIDRTRTLIESVALSNDPEIAVTPALAELAKETGLEIGIEDLGTTKVRSLMSSIGYLRRNKGTIGSISSYISALTGCQVEYENDPLDPKPHIFHIYAQRSNFVVDPEFQYSTITVATEGSVNNGTTSYAATVQQTASAWGVYTYGGTTMGASVFPTITNSNNGIFLTLPAGAYGNRTVLVYSRTPYPYVETVEYGSSFKFSASAGASFNNFHTSLDTTKQAWETGVAGGTMPAQMYYDTTWNVGASFAANNSYDSGTNSGRYSVEYSNNSGASATVSVVPVLEFTMSPGSTIFVGEWLVENNVAKPYFSGSTREGGFIPVNTGATGSGSFDHFWSGNPDLSFSFFVNDRERSVKTTERILEDYVIPVTMLSDHQLDWNYYPGK